MKRIAMLALFGAIGFGIGGLFPGPAALFAFAGSFQRTDWPSAIFAFAVLGLGFAAKGALGGTALGLALSRGRRRVAALALFGSIGFLAGGLLFLFLIPRGMYLAHSSGIVLLDGALGSAALGLALRDRRKIVGLALAGALGFWLGLMISNYFTSWLQFGWLLLPVIKFSLQGLIGGALIGAFMGYLEKPNAT